MNEPDISPLLARLGGADYTDGLKRQLLDAADSADDPAYASRLREIAAGRRPLRSLLHDPKWQAQYASLPRSGAAPSEAETRAVDEIRSRVAEAVAAGGSLRLAPEEARALAAQAIARGARAAEIARQEELTGWATVHADDEERQG